uniref:AlNc14C32G2961 protein n=1 Tax=Albugo laibachii Nc14 TaxID=890382 RepID=F0W811_9STRA|nr:AlNc14C32G2961 [Albugo laibachii Nc14]|eukprot:CCA17264.1 AlNc14C32G2961 [Albugo laibachii Nc14]
MANWTALNSHLIELNAFEEKETKEAQESRHKELYEQALRLQKEKPNRAKDIYHELLSVSIPFLQAVIEKADLYAEFSTPRSSCLFM